MDVITPAYHYPNRMGRIIFSAMEDVLGQKGINVILNLASLSELIDHYPAPDDLKSQFSFDMIGRLSAALESYYGPHGGRGIALRVGRACFQPGLREFGSLYGLTDITFRLLPLKMKLKMGVHSMAEIFNKYSDQQVQLEETENTIIWKIVRCPLCWGRKAEGPCCQMAVGVLQEALYWASGGKFFHVEETQCIALGNQACSILIDKSPMS